MKINGFTLAETMVAMSIIGIIAAITLPLVMRNNNEQQYISSLKKLCKF